MRLTTIKYQQINRTPRRQLQHRCCSRLSPITISKIPSKSVLILYIVFTLITTMPGRLYAQQMHHRVRPGETLSKISARYEVTIQSIARANSIYNVNLIRAGQILIIPATFSSEVVATQQNRVEPAKPVPTLQPTPTKTVREAPTNTRSGKQTHRRPQPMHKPNNKPGNGFTQCILAIRSSGLGRCYGVRISNIQQRNGLLTTVIRVNQCLIIPPGIQATPAPDRRRNSERSPPQSLPTTLTHTIKDTPASRTDDVAADRGGVKRQCVPKMRK